MTNMDNEKKLDKMFRAWQDTPCEYGIDGPADELCQLYVTEAKKYGKEVTRINGKHYIRTT